MFNPNQVLQGFIHGAVRNFLRKKKQESLDGLNKQMKGMQSASSLWKETAKHLEKSVGDLGTQNSSLSKKIATMSKKVCLAWVILMILNA